MDTTSGTLANGRPRREGLRRWGMIVVALGAGAALKGWLDAPLAAADSPNVVKASAFIIVDGEGKERCRLVASDSSKGTTIDRLQGLDILDSQGLTRARVNWEPAPANSPRGVATYFSVYDGRGNVIQRFPNR